MIASIDQRYLEIDQRITGDCTRLSGLDNSFFDSRAEVLRNSAAKDLIDPFKALAAAFWLEDDLTIPKLTTSPGLFLVTSLDLDRLRDGFFVRHLWRVKRDFDVKTIS